MNSEVGEEWGRAETILSHFVVVVSRDSAEKKCNQLSRGLYGADYIFWKYLVKSGGHYQTFLL
jgi:hypothetical protein